MSVLKKLGRAFKAAYNELGEELPDPTPVAVPLDFQRPPTIHEMIAQAVKSQSWREKMEAAGHETWEEANDFDIEDEPLPVSPYEEREMQEEFFNRDRYEARRGAVRGRQKRVQDAAQPGGVREEGGRKDVSDGSAGSGASAVRPVVKDEAVREGGSKPS